MRGTLKLLSSFLKDLGHLNLALALAISILPWNSKLNSVCIILLTMLVIMQKIRIGKKQAYDFEQFFIGASLYFVSIVWLINTNNLTDGLFYLERTFSGLLFPLIFFLIGSTATQIDKKTIFLSFIISCLLRYLYFLGAVLELELVFILDYWKEILPQFNQLSKEHGIHPTYFSIFLGFSSILCVAESHNYKNKYAMMTMSFILAIMNLTIAAKMPLFVFFVLYGYFFAKFFFKKKAGKFKNLLYVATFILCLGISAYVSQIPNYIAKDIINYYDLYYGIDVEDSQYYSKNSNLITWEKTNRVYIWRSTWATIKDNLFWGVGTGDVNDELNETYEKLGYNYLAEKSTNTHNQFLDFILRFGLLGILVISYFAFLLFRRIWKGNLPYKGLLLLFFLSCLTENLLNRQLGIVFFHFFSNMCIMLNKEQKSCNNIKH